MQSGEYITDRWMVGIIADICRDHSIELTRFSGDWLLRLRHGDVTRYVIGYKFDLNNAAAAGIAQDKVATAELLEVDGVAAVQHMLVRTKAATASDWKARAGNDFVIKPLSGTSGHGVRRFHDVAAADEWMKQSGIEAWAISPYIDIRRESRLIVLDDDVLAAYEKQPVEVHSLRMFNLGKGALARDIEPNDALIVLARRAQQTLGLRLAAVDIIEDADGNIQVLEVNEGIMMENYMRQSDENKARGYAVYEGIVMRMME
jgi:glutathione synthase/RimK-type ligase-like ATP-grasp enzyme